MNLPVGSEYNNDTFATYLCSQLDSDVVGLALVGPVEQMYILPDCVRTKSPSLTNIVLTYITINNFAVLPPTVTSITAYNPSIVGTTLGAADGFADDGSVDWEEIWTLFPSLYTLIFQQPRLTATLPIRLLSTLNTFTITDSGLSGSFSENFLAGFASSSIFSLTINLASNKIAGTLPPGLFSPLSSLTGLVYLNFNGNGNLLVGPVPSNFLHPSSAQTFIIFFNNNKLSGQLPASLFTSAVILGDFRLDFSNNELTGPLPSILFNKGVTIPATTSILTLNFDYNKLNGTIPSTFLTNGLTQNATFTAFVLGLRDNQLEGSIPENLFYTHVDGKRETRELNGTGSKKRESAIAYIGGSFTTQLDFSDNLLNGSIPSAIMEAYRLNDGGSGTLYFYASSNAFTGPLPALCSPTKVMNFEASYNQFEGDIPNEWQACRFKVIRINSNPGLNGTIPPQLLSLTDLLDFNADSTPLSGDLPTFTTAWTLSSTNINFCSANSIAAFTSSSVISCIVAQSNFCDCQQTYALCGRSDCRSPTTMPTTTPIATPVHVPAACSGTAPSSLFTCIGGSWTAEVITSDTLVLQPNSGSVVVTGNVTSSSIILNGLGTTIEITGCAANLTEVHIDLTQTQLQEIGKSKLFQLLTTLSSNCSSALDNVTVSASIVDRGCRKVKVAKVTSSDRSTLSGLFTMDNSACNTWWIILVSVLCGVVLLILITFVLLSFFWKPFRTKFRPFSSAREMRENV